MTIYQAFNHRSTKEDSGSTELHTFFSSVPRSIVATPPSPTSKIRNRQRDKRRTEGSKDKRTGASCWIHRSKKDARQYPTPPTEVCSDRLTTAMEVDCHDTPYPHSMLATQLLDATADSPNDQNNLDTLQAYTAAVEGGAADFYRISEHQFVVSAWDPRRVSVKVRKSFI
jgi:hypothetical protein